MEKIKAFEDSINTVWTEDQIKEIRGFDSKIQQAMGN
jgi:hypothetical protein